jgi:hypothetical protein
LFEIACDAQRFEGLGGAATCTLFRRSISFFRIIFRANI